MLPSFLLCSSLCSVSALFSSSIVFLLPCFGLSFFCFCFVLLFRRRLVGWPVLSCKTQQFAADIFSWFTQSKDLLYIDDLETLLYEAAALSFNIVIEDGSDQEVAEELIIMYDVCSGGNFASVERLREASRS
ncbi:pre-rRNA-processing protein TSR2 protein [Trifolium repens]|nr:pre-rRNA-processing protein TSR2 protein [Trifolium repens]